MTDKTTQAAEAYRFDAELGNFSDEFLTGLVWKISLIFSTKNCKLSLIV